MRAQSTRFLPSNPVSLQLYLWRKLNWRVDPTWHAASAIDFYWNMSHRYWNCFWFTAPAYLFPLRKLRSGFDVISVVLLSQSELRHTGKSSESRIRRENIYSLYKLILDICKNKMKVVLQWKSSFAERKKIQFDFIKWLKSNNIYWPHVTMSLWILYEIRLFIWNVKTAHDNCRFSNFYLFWAQTYLKGVIFKIWPRLKVQKHRGQPVTVATTAALC